MIAPLLFGRKALLVALAVFCSWYIVSDYLFDEDNITHLAGKYYTASLDDGVALHLYENADKPYNDPLLKEVFATQIGGRYLVARAGANLYFAFPVNAVTREEAQKKRMGPFSKSELMNKLLKLNGDTLLRHTHPF